MSRRLVVALGSILVVAAGTAWLVAGHGPWGTLADTPGNAFAKADPQLIARYLATSDRVRKAALIKDLTSPPQVVIFGGSRALRFNPAYIRQRTGLTGFNAAVTGARPADAFALLSLLHARFPRARFHLLWVIHADEFDEKPLDLGILKDPALARFFPRSLVKSQLRWELAHLSLDPTNQGRVFAADGHVVSDVYNVRFPYPGTDVGAVLENIRKELTIYATTPDKIGPLTGTYFVKTLKLMERVSAAPPVIVAAPVDPRVYAATYSQGWEARHRLMLDFLARLRKHYTFSFLDLSKAASCGCTQGDFYDGIHLTPGGTEKVFNAVLRRFPRAFRG